MTEILNIHYLVSIFFAVLVIVVKNPIISVLFLIGLFLSVALYLVLLGISFIGLSYLLVYVGAVSILFIFILMLINVRLSELSDQTNNSIPLAIIVTLIFSYCMQKLLPLNYINLKLFISDEINAIYMYKHYISTKFKYQINETIHYVTTNSWDNKLTEINDISGIGNVFYTSYSIWLVLTSIILLLAMVGAIVITIKQKN